MKTVEDYMHGYTSLIKSAEMWYQSAHHVAKGPGFLSDHNELFGNLYKDLGEHFDLLVEKSIALSGEESCACPIMLSKSITKIFENYNSPVNRKIEDIIDMSIDIITSIINSLTEVYDFFESEGYLTLGLDDLLTSFANKYEQYLYFLVQRSK